MPTQMTNSENERLDAWSSRIKAPLGPGAYLTDNLHIAEKLAWGLNSVNPFLCAIYAPKEFYQDWPKIYIPRLVMVRKLNNKVRYEGYQLLESRQQLETYLELLGNRDGLLGSILVTGWNYVDVPNGEGFTMKIPRSKYKHFSRTAILLGASEQNKSN
ncbi:hypothetical protein BKA69DRAFT_1167103 [Paraphysoderma sedebokerense]|nr:hypothetical protein BKA69DRAFT_1167103 [Paraphysoderma sedebokerense]